MKLPSFTVILSPPPLSCLIRFLALLAASFFSNHRLPAAEAGTVELFDGRSLAGWRAAENPASFRVVDGAIVCAGPRGHLFYVGAEGAAEFEDFEFSAEVMTEPGANSGVFFHTAWQASGWPGAGFEVQVNNSQPRQKDYLELKMTGSLYGIVNVMNTAPHVDNEWFDYHIIVKGKTITIKVNGKETVTYTEPADGSLPDAKSPGRKLSSGTFAIQAHDPGSEVHIKSIRIKPL